eukprot:TRINITY_DN58123_c0_g1_i1.p2 TRINITY_DN58123_c0_g1~~TRINITY_DN58123_c0_g1_i1.p2  ORF type:complete len:123 (-),score=27.57 TRINITY_DN58123_c0_g1_i1:219-587(-)
MDAGGSFFFFKQKTAYEMLRSLVGSEMCIRDRRLSYGGASPNLNRRSRCGMMSRISICAKFFPRQLRGSNANGENRCDCGVMPAIGQLALASSCSTNSRSGLKRSASSPHSSRFRCRGQFAI